MTLQFARDFLLWCAIFNYAVLLAWFAAFRFAHACDAVLVIRLRHFHPSRP